MATAIRIFTEAVGQVAGHEGDVRREAIDAGALHEVEAAG
jgi:hypothetical protein